MKETTTNEKARKRALLLHYIGTDAFDIYETLEDDEEPSYASTKKVLTDYFTPKVNKEYERFVFRNCKQRGDENIEQFCTRLRQLSVNCGFESVNCEVKSQIIQGCTSTSLKRKAMRDDWTLEKLLENAKAAELAEPHSAAMNSDHSLANRVTRKPTHNGQKRTRPNRTCYNCGNSFPHRDAPCPAKDIKCYKCGKTGHFAKYCKPMDTKKNGRPNKGEPRANNVSQDSHEETPVPASDDDHAFSVETKTRGLPRINVLIHNRECNVLVDSGSSVNTVNSVLARELGVKVQRSNSKLFAYATNTPLQVEGEFTTTVESQNKIVPARFVVVKNADIPLLSCR